MGTILSSISVKDSTYHLFPSVREEILFYPVSGNEWDMNYLLPTATFSLSLTLSLSLSFQPYYQNTTSSFYDSYYYNSIKRKHKGKKKVFQDKMIGTHPCILLLTLACSSAAAVMKKSERRQTSTCSSYSKCNSLFFQQ